MSFLNGVINKPEGGLKVEKCIEFEIAIEQKICKLLVIKYSNDDKTKENYGLQIHPDNPLEENEIQFAVFKKLYHSLKAGIENDVD